MFSEIFLSSIITFINYLYLWLWVGGVVGSALHPGRAGAGAGVGAGLGRDEGVMRLPRPCLPLPHWVVLVLRVAGAPVPSLVLARVAGVQGAPPHVQRGVEVGHHRRVRRHPGCNGEQYQFPVLIHLNVH